MTYYVDLGPSLGDILAEDFRQHEAAMVPRAGIEPALREEPHFECGASTNSANGATRGVYHGIAHPRKEEMPPMDPVDAQVEADVASGVRPERAEIVPHSTPRQIGVSDKWYGTWAWDHLEPLGERTNGVGPLRIRLSRLECTAITLPGNLKVRFMYDSRGYFYAQVFEPDSVDNVTDEAMTWYGRKWLLSEHMTDGEIVQTVFKAVITAVEHEVREQFLYKGESVFDPHYDLEKLVELRAEKNATVLREEKA